MGKLIDETGNQYGDLIVLGRDIEWKGNNAKWKCECSCGTIFSAYGQKLRSGQTKSCPECARKRVAKQNTIDITGQKFGYLTAIEQIGTNKRGALWRCKCDCGNETTANCGDLRCGHRTSCGCIQLNNLTKHNQEIFKDLTGQQFGYLTVLEKSDKTDKNYETYWKCKCICGNIIDVKRANLLSGNTTSCGCKRESHGELKIKEILTNNNILFEREKKFDTCKFTDTGNQAKFDFYINNKYLIEYDGEQHFKATNKGWNTEENLKKTQEHDQIKNQWCKDNNIPLIRIPYTHLKDLCLEDLLLETSEYIVQ